MTRQINSGGSFTLPGTELQVQRMGYGAMQIAGTVWGPPQDVNGAIAVLREVVAAGVNHIDTSDYYDRALLIKLSSRRCTLIPMNW